MNGSLQQALQNGKAHPNIKKVWMIRWVISFVFLFVFLMLVFATAFIPFIFSSGPLGIIFFYIIVPIVLGFLVSYIWAILY